MPVPRSFPPGTWALGVVGVCLFSGCAGHPRAVLYSPPSLLPHTTVEMKTPGFWISRHPSPDAVILSPEEIARFNERVRQELHLTKDLSQWPASVPGRALREQLEKQLEDLRARGLVLLDGRKPGASYWSAARQAFNLEAISLEIPRHYGLATGYADQRFLPVKEGLYVKAHDADFDELQNSALDIGTPVVVLHRSLDGKWFFVESPLSSGWVNAEDVGLAIEEQFNVLGPSPFVVVTVPKADIYLNREMTDFYGFVRMGVRLPLMRFDGDYAEVTVPQRRPDGTAALVPGFMAAADIHEGYLPYMPRHVLIQAFKMLHQPYGWGGMYGAQDCSRFLQEIFATVGIELPRDSKNQSQTGKALAAWSAGAPIDEKLRLLRESAVGGITLLGMRGHIMLYLATLESRAYAIHSAWAYRRPRHGRDDTFVVNRVVVSDLTLGEGSRRGSLLERLNAARLVR